MKRTKKDHAKNLKSLKKQKGIISFFEIESRGSLFCYVYFEPTELKGYLLCALQETLFLSETHHKSRLINRHHTRPQSEDKDAAFSADLLGAFYS